jgi:hypothetical protein
VKIELIGLHLFGCPRPGFQPLADALAPYPVSNWRNGDARSHDFVTNLPFNLPGLPYVEPRDFRLVTAPPPVGDDWGLFAWHHMALYREGLEGADASPEDKAISDLLLLLYSGDCTQWDAIRQPQQSDGVCWALRHMDGWDALLFRGSVTPQDWLRDFTAGSHATAAHPKLGPCHEGFLLGMDETMAVVMPLLAQPLRIGGHSLGAGRSSIAAGIVATA